MDYEEILLQITDVLKAHNRYHMKSPDHEQAVKAIRDIVTPKGKWVEGEQDGSLLGLVPYYWYNCSECGYHFSLNRGSKKPNYCQECGARMESDV